jgi:hypothetical protein
MPNNNRPNVNAAARRLALALETRLRLHEIGYSNKTNISKANAEIKAAQKNLKNAWARLGVNSSKFLTAKSRW